MKCESIIVTLIKEISGLILAKIQNLPCSLNRRLFCVWCNFEWVLHFELTPDDYNVNIYAQQLQQEYDAFKAHYLTLVNWKCTLLQHDNAPVQTANVTKHRPEELEGIEVLPQPAYRSNLVISDCHLFWAMVHLLHRWRFNNVDEVFCF